MSVYPLSNTIVEAKDDRARLFSSLTPQSSPFLTRKPLGVKEAIELSYFYEHCEPSTCLSQLVSDGDIEKLRSFSAIDSEIDSLDTNGFAALHYAAQLDRVEILNLLLDNGANRDVQGENGVTPLHLASKYGSEKVLPVLLRRGADPSLKTKYGCTALHLAARKENIVIVKTLLHNKKVNVNARDARGYTPLHDACTCKNYQVCEFLLKYDAAIDLRTNENLTPVHITALSGDIRILELLLDKAAEQGRNSTELLECNSDGMKPVLLSAVIGGSSEVVEAILRTGVAVNQSEPNTFGSLHAAAVFGKPKVVESLISKGGDLEARDHAFNTPLHWASIFNRVKAIKILLQAGARLNARDNKGSTPFLCAVRAGSLASAQLLLESGADIRTCDSSLKNCLHVAIEEENMEMVCFLLQRSGLELINMVDKRGRAPLHYAVFSRNSEILEALIDRGCECLVIDENLKSPLHLATESGKTRNVEKLLEACRPLMVQRDDMGRQALHYAAMNGRSKLCTVLLGCAEEVNTLDIDQWAPLLWAAASGCVETVEILLDKGASTRTCDTRGNTALHVAATHGHTGVILCLLDRGAPILVNNESLNCLDYAIENQLYCAIRTIVHHRRWREVFDTRGKDSQNLLGKLIDECPSAAEIILDNCIERGPNPRAFDYLVTYNFRLLDPGPDDVSAKDGTRYFGLLQLVSCSREQLVQHPLARKLLHIKWKSFGFPLYFANLFMYLCFVIVLTIFMQTQRADISLLQGFTETNYKVKGSFNRVSNIAGLVFVVFHMVKELFQIYMLKLRYFLSFQNLIDWIIYVTGFVYLIAYATDSRYLIKTDLPWQCGTTCIFFAYMNLIIQFRAAWFIGLYVTMFIEVFKTLLQVMSMVVMFILAYALVFFILFKEQAPFADFGKSIVKTTVMTVGELNYDELLITSLHGPTNKTGIASPLVPFPFISNVFFYFFMLTMPIVVMNLLVGLAVGDIEAIRKTSNFRQTAAKIKFLTETESRYPGFITRWLYKPELVEKPNCKMINRWRFFLFGGSPKGALEDDQGYSLNKEMRFRYQQLDKSVHKTKRRVKSLATLLEKQNRLLVALTTRRGMYQDDIEESNSLL